MNDLHLYWRYVTVAIRSEMQYRASFVMFTFGHLFQVGLEFLGIWVLFDRFGSLRGWSLPEIALLYGMANTSFALAEGIGRGFDTFHLMVRLGEFDRFLVRPRSTALQVAGREVQLLRIGRFLQGLIVLIWATLALGVRWSLGKGILLVATIVSGAFLFIGLFILQATLSFWTIESLEIMNTVTYGGVETTQYPISLYRKWFREFFTFVIPLACVSYFPALAILERPDPLGTPLWFQYTAPAIGTLFLVVALQIWRLGVRHYRSTGS
ncbi:MAG: ABC transporter permease [Chloroflexi bacterium RBG_13_56_8]|nr:MAG: ABC transporter permease [Chloroflexi bacterium RBG_13_56_8]